MEPIFDEVQKWTQVLDFKSIVKELKAQRARIAGEDGWLWRRGYPERNKQCCLLFWHEHDTTKVLHKDTCVFVIRAAVHILHLPPHESSLLTFNDANPNCSPEVLVDIFDYAISLVEKAAPANV